MAIQLDRAWNACWIAFWNACWIATGSATLTSTISSTSLIDHLPNLATSNTMPLTSLTPAERANAMQFLQFLVNDAHLVDPPKRMLKITGVVAENLHFIVKANMLDDDTITFPDGAIGYLIRLWKKNTDGDPLAKATYNPRKGEAVTFEALLKNFTEHY